MAYFKSKCAIIARHPGTGKHHHMPLVKRDITFFSGKTVDFISIFKVKKFSYEFMSRGSERRRSCRNAMCTFHCKHHREGLPSVGLNEVF